MVKTLVKTAATRVTAVRLQLLERQPFFGRLLMHINLGFADCDTAYTDMKRIVFDPAFVSRLDDRALSFVFMHELMHCVLKHCTRSGGKLHTLYNIACDIVVNSIILDAMGLKDITIDKCNAMHLAPNGKEGLKYTADEVYEMLLKMKRDKTEEKYGDGFGDSHGEWEKIEDEGLLEEIWNRQIIEASQASGYNGTLPAGLKRIVKIIERTPKINWKQVLRDFLQNDIYDYNFCFPDKRFTGDFIMPSFREDTENFSVSNVWFVVDTSGSVSTSALSEAYAEIKDAVNQIDRMSGLLSFFDCEVSKPEPFESVTDLESIAAIGGGGTSFEVIFEYLKENFENNLPTAIIIITDGYAPFPERSAALDIPVIWLIVDSNVNAPWGECIHIYSDKAEED